MLGPDPFEPGVVAYADAVQARSDLANQQPGVTVEGRPSRRLDERHRQGSIFILGESSGGKLRRVRLGNDALPEVHRSSLVEHTHLQGPAAPVLDGSAVDAWTARSALAACILLVPVEFGSMDLELLSRDRVLGIGRPEIGKEKLQQPAIAQLRGLSGRLAEPRLEGVHAGLGDREYAPPPAPLLLGLGREAALHQSRRFGIEERMRERPEVTHGRSDKLLEVVRARGPFAGQQSEHEIGGGAEQVA
jgi:hypothetical protein